MPREHSDDPRHRAIERRDPRMAARPLDDDVRIDRRNAALYHDLPSVASSDFEPLDTGGGEDLRMRGHAGIGPNDHWISDVRVQEILHERLTGADSIDASAVVAIADAGVVTLSGWVPHRAMKHASEEIAHGVPGVREVVNHIRVGESADAIGKPGQAIRSGDAQGSGFSSSERVDIDDRHIGDDDR